MRTPSFVKLFIGLAVVCLSACQCGPAEPALQVVINVDKDVTATCVVLEVSAGGTVRLSQELKRPAGKDSFRVGIKKLQLPTDLQLVARSYTSASGSGCAEPRAQTSLSAPVEAKFPKSEVATFTLEIHAPPADLDADRDGHIALSKGGDDCNDNDKAIHPGLAALCGSVLDNDCDGKIGCADAECVTAAICTSPPAALAFVTTAAPVNVNTCSPPLTVEVRDAASAPVVAAVDTVVSLGMNPQGGVGYFFDPLCLTSVTQLTIVTGQSRASFYFKAAAPGMFDATATINNVPTASQTQTVVQPQVSQVAFVNAPVTVQAGTCSAPLTIQTRDANGTAAPIAGGVSIALSSNQAGVTFYSDVTCATALPNNALPIATGGSSGTFYVKATLVQATTLTATLATIPPATQALTVTAGPAAQLAFATSAQGIQSGACSNVVTVETRDAANNLAPVAAPTTVNLSATGVAIALFVDSNCTVPVTAPRALVAGASSVSFHFKGTTVGMAVITADSTGLTSAMQTESVGVGAPAKLVLSAAQSITAGQCSAAATVETQDVNSNPSNVTGTALTVTLTNPGAGLAFFSDPGCATALSGTVSIPVGGTSATFYFRGTTAGPQDVTVSATGLSPATRTHTLTAGMPSVLVFTSAAQSVAAGVCAQFDLESRDAFGNVSAPATAATVNLTSTPPLTFSAAAGCAAPVTSVTLTGTTVSFFARSNVAGTRNLTATAPFAAAMQVFTITPGVPTHVGFVVQPSNAAAGAAIAPPVQVAIQDALGNTVTTSTANVIVALNPGPGVLSGTLTVAAVAGIATFSDLSIDKSGTGYTLGATSSLLVPTTSAAFDIAAGPAAALTFTTQPTTATAGAALAPSVQITIVDALGNTVPSTANVTLAIGTNPGAGVLSGTTTVAAVAGVATFPGLSINRSGTGYTLSATSAALPTATSSAFNIDVGAASKLAFTVQPTHTVAGASIAPAVQVTVQDALGNTVVASTANVTIALGTNPGPGVLSGTATVAAVAGVATFSDLSINRTGAGYTLGATSAGLTAAVSSGFNITPGAPAVLAFVVQPASTTAGAPLDPAPRVAIQDALGNRVTPSTSNVTIAIGTNPGAGVLSGTLTVAAVAGLATFSGLSINRTGTGYTLTATSGALPVATSNAFNISPGAAAKLAFTVQPTSAVSTVAIAPAPQVTVQDALGNTVTPSTASITVAIANNPNAGILSGTVTAAAVAGVATFSTLSIDKAGVGYTLDATSGALTAATSSAFNITAGAPVRLVILSTPLTQPALDCSIVRTVELQDAGGNPAVSGSATVVGYAAAPGSATTAFFSDAACTIATTGATRTIAAGTSQVSFYFSAQNATPTLTLTASSGSLIDGTQTATITQATPTQLKFTTPPPQIEAGFCQALTLERQDVADRPTSPATATTISRASSPATGIAFFSDPTCTTPLAATFDILAGASSTVVYVLGTTGATYSLTASASGLSNGIINVVVLPMVRRGSCTIAAASNSVTCAVTPAIPGNVISRTFLVFQAAGLGNTPDSANATCRLTNTSGVNVVCDRSGSSASTLGINWQTVSFAQGFAAGGVTVQHVSGAFGGFTANPLVVTVTAVDLSQSFLLFSHSTGGNTNGANDFLTARLTSTTTVAIAETAGTTFAAAGDYALQVVSFANSSVLRGTATAAVAAASVPITGLAVSVVNRTFPLVTSRTSTTADDTAICKRKVRGAVTSTTALTFTRGDGAGGSCTDSDIAELAWERIELPAGNLVQSVNVLHANNAATGSANVTTPVDLTRSIVFMAGQGIGGQAAGETNYASDDVVGALLGLASLDVTGTTVTVTRPVINLGTASFTPFVIQFVP